MNWEKLKTALACIISACCLIFTGWAFATIQHRQVIESGPVPEHVGQQWGVQV